MQDFLLEEANEIYSFLPQTLDLAPNCTHMELINTKHESFLSFWTFYLFEAFELAIYLSKERCQMLLPHPK